MEEKREKIDERRERVDLHQKMQVKLLKDKKKSMEDKDL